MRTTTIALLTAGLVLTACDMGAPEGLAPTDKAATTVKMDFFHRPLPDIPLPNDLATRYDASSATGRRINASMIAPTGFERTLREMIDQLDGWGVFQPITVPFTGPLDINSILAGHRDADYDPSNDVVYLVNVDRDSAKFGQLTALDLGNGNYPVVLEDTDKYWKNDSRGNSLSLIFEEANEDTNGNGVLDPGEDTDADGVLDVPNYLPGHNPAPDDLAGRADALMSFYERQTNTLIVRPMEPLDERTTYAVVITKRLLDADGQPVGSPFDYINHTAQNDALKPLPEVLPAGLALKDVAFAFTFTTQSVKSSIVAVRDGLYGVGAQSHLATDFPAELLTLEDMRDPGPGVTKPKLMYGENWLELLPVLGEAFLGFDDNSAETQSAITSARYVDYFVVGSYNSPQLFSREDENGDFLDYNRQAWPPDLDRVAAKATAEKVYFTLAVPRKEISVRGEGKPAPLIILGHGYTGNRFSVFELGAYLVKRGFAVLAIDGPSHGVSLSEAEHTTAISLFKAYGLEVGGKAILSDRAFDQNGDGVKDSGSDFWTSYLFHTRDVVRQFALDYMQIIRIIRGFDGQNNWAFDTDGNGQPNLAGDFDGDGVVDVGKDSPIYMTGGSLGGIMSMVMGGVEPEIRAIAPIAGGGGYSDMGFRSRQGGVPEGFFLTGVMGPLYVGTRNADTGAMDLETIVADLNSREELPITSVTGIKTGDILVVENLTNGERGCGAVAADGSVRAAVATDKGDLTRLVFYGNGAYVLPGTICEITDGAMITSVDTFDHEVSFQGKTTAAGSPLAALGHGLGKRRAHPGLRRLRGIGQLVLDPADPVVFAPHLMRDPLYFAGTDTQTNSHALIITTMGDMNVPASSGITYARAAGIIDYKTDDPRFGKPMNQVLIDNYTAEAVHKIPRYTDSAGNPVHMDVENFSAGNDIWGDSVPRTSEPLRIGFDTQDPIGGQSAAIFPLTNPTGQHGFDAPGKMTDRVRSKCIAECAVEGTCSCASMTSYDIGSFMLNMIGRYFANDGMQIDADLCLSRGDCSEHKQPPPHRELSALP